MGGARQIDGKNTAAHRAKPIKQTAKTHHRRMGEARQIYGKNTAAGRAKPIKAAAYSNFPGFMIPAGSITFLISRISRSSTASLLCKK